MSTRTRVGVGRPWHSPTTTLSVAVTPNPAPVTTLRPAGYDPGLVAEGVRLLRDLPTAVEVHGTLDAGPAGGVLLLLAQLAYLPTLVVWAGAVLAGPGTWLGAAHVGPAPAALARNCRHPERGRGQFPGGPVQAGCGEHLARQVGGAVGEELVDLACQS